MSTTYIAVALRREVKLRALYRCEYCRVPQAEQAIPYHIDHIIPEKHGGPTTLPNLALACHECNLKKGSSFAAYSVEWDEAVFLYHPRKHRWSEHLTLLPNGIIRGLSKEGEATVIVLKMNALDRVVHRRALIEAELM